MSLLRRRLVDRLATLLAGAAILAAAVPLASVLWQVVSRGAAGLSWAFFTHRPTPVGEPGGGVGRRVRA